MIPAEQDFVRPHSVVEADLRRLNQMQATAVAVAMTGEYATEGALLGEVRAVWSRRCECHGADDIATLQRVVSATWHVKEQRDARREAVT